MLLVLAVLLLGLAAMGLRAGWPALRLWRAVRGLAPVTATDLVRRSLAEGYLAPTPGAVTGATAPAITGELASTVNHEPCVWHRHTVHHRQTRYRTDAQGRTRRRTSRKRVGDTASREPFRLVTAGDVVEVRPDLMRVDGPRRLPVRILPGLATQAFPDADALMTGGGVQNAYHHREWILAAGTPLFVLGEVVGRGRRVVVRRPAKGPHLISTRSAVQVRRRSQLLAISGLGVAALAGITGLVLGLAGLL